MLDDCLTDQAVEVPGKATTGKKVNYLVLMGEMDLREKLYQRAIIPQAVVRNFTT
jgi:hypothetical protein